MTEYFEVNKILDKLAVIRRRQITAILEDEKLCAAHFPALRFIKEHEGCTQVSLAEFLCITPASVATLTKRLEKAGFIKRQEDKNNLRCKNLFITQKGIAAAKACKNIFDEYDKRMYSGVGEDELDSLKNMLQKILDNIRKGEFHDKNVSKIDDAERP